MENDVILIQERNECTFQLIDFIQQKEHFIE